METQTIAPDEVLSAAELAFHNAPTDANWKLVTKARDAVLQAETRDRIAEEISTREAAERKTAELARKRTRLVELNAYLGQQVPEQTAALAKRIGDIMLAALPLVLKDEPELIDASNAAYSEALQLAEDLGEPRPPYALSYDTVSQMSSDYVRSKMPDGTQDPTILSKFAGKWW